VDDITQDANRKHATVITRETTGIRLSQKGMRILVKCLANLRVAGNYRWVSAGDQVPEVAANPDPG
jgi:hypothetical protein